MLKFVFEEGNHKWIRLEIQIHVNNDWIHLADVGMLTTEYSLMRDVLARFPKNRRLRWKIIGYAKAYSTLFMESKSSNNMYK